MDVIRGVVINVGVITNVGVVIKDSGWDLSVGVVICYML